MTQEEEQEESNWWVERGHDRRNKYFRILGFDGCGENKAPSRGHGRRKRFGFGAFMYFDKFGVKMKKISSLEWERRA